MKQRTIAESMNRMSVAQIAVLHHMLSSAESSGCETGYDRDVIAALSDTMNDVEVGREIDELTCELGIDSGSDDSLNDPMTAEFTFRGFGVQQLRDALADEAIARLRRRA